MRHALFVEIPVLVLCDHQHRYLDTFASAQSVNQEFCTETAGASNPQALSPSRIHCGIHPRGERYADITSLLIEA
jgi:hypothetical protein